jgi:Protein of unknown function (DUF3313)
VTHPKLHALAIVLASASAMLAACQATNTTQPSPIDRSSTMEGLELVRSSKLDAVYRKPGAQLTGYNKLLLRPVEVRFSSNFNKGSSPVTRLDDADLQRIRVELASAFRDEFRSELQTEGGYVMVDNAGADVLEMRAAIVNLYITAPDTSMQTAGRVKTYTTDAGEMTLIAELHDSVTGELLTRAYDRRQADDSHWQWTNSVTNTAEARRIIASWADTLRNALDVSRQGGEGALAEGSQ